MHKDPVISGVRIKKVYKTTEIKQPLYFGEGFQVNQDEYAMQVEGIGTFYVKNGEEVEYTPSPEADPDWVNIYLNGQILAALLHQRKIINFHASSFIFYNRGFMILGETGAGKSSLTAAFTLDSAGFLSDDFTPVIFNHGMPYIWPVYRTIKVRCDTIGQLKIAESRLRKAESGSGKFFLKVSQGNVDKFPLHYILKIEIGEVKLPMFSFVDQTEKFSLLRSEICSWEMLNGMPYTEKAYLEQLIEIIKNVEIIKVVRPKVIQIAELYSTICDYMSDNYRLQ